MCLCPVVVFCLSLHSRSIALRSRLIPMPDADCVGEVTEMFLSLRYVLFVFCGSQSCLCLCLSALLSVLLSGERSSFMLSVCV